jgi:hypothetical protein
MSKEFIGIEFPKEDQEKFFSLMTRMETELGRSTKSVLKAAMGDLLRSVRAATKIAPKRRRIVQHKTAFDQARRHSDLQAYRVEGWLGKPRTYQTKIVYAKTKENAVKDHALIKRRGLAKRVWNYGVQKMGSSSRGGDVSGFASHIEGLARRLVRVDRSDEYIAIHNRISYAIPALKGGESGIDAAMGKAAESMERKLMEALKRAAA